MSPPVTRPERHGRRKGRRASPRPPRAAPRRPRPGRRRGGDERLGGAGVAQAQTDRVGDRQLAPSAAMLLAKRGPLYEDGAGDRSRLRHARPVHLGLAQRPLVSTGAVGHLMRLHPHAYRTACPVTGRRHEIVAGGLHVRGFGWRRARQERRSDRSGPGVRAGRRLGDPEVVSLPRAPTASACRRTARASTPPRRGPRMRRWQIIAPGAHAPYCRGGTPLRRLVGAASPRCMDLLDVDGAGWMRAATLINGAPVSPRRSAGGVRRDRRLPKRVPRGDETRDCNIATRGEAGSRHRPLRRCTFEPGAGNAAAPCVPAPLAWPGQRTSKLTAYLTLPPSTVKSRRHVPVVKPSVLTLKTWPASSES